MALPFQDRGPKSKLSRPEAPETANFDYEVPVTEISLIK